MNRGLPILLFLVMTLWYTGAVAQQEDGVSYKMRDHSITLTIDLDYFREHSADTILKQFGLTQSDLDSMSREEGEKLLYAMGWEIQRWNKRKLVLVQDLTAMPAMHFKMGPFLFNGEGEDSRPGYPDPAKVVFGFNALKRPEVVVQRDDAVQFFLPDHLDANSVRLSGNFNDWSTLGNTMHRTDSGWVASVALSPGKYYYKYIIDGIWHHDTYNNKSEPDGHGGQNSVYYVINDTFTLDTFQQARVVALAGSFNNWDPRDAYLRKTASGWQLPVYLREGVHTYKYVVDGDWTLDPSNPSTQPDGSGNVNSVIMKGDTFHFTLKGYSQARQVFVAGSFNQWNPAALEMKKTSSGWYLPYILPPGNYEYKFLVDGVWLPDPDNPYTNGVGDFLNSVLTIEPNHTFTLPGYSKAHDVYCTGSFNGWSESGYRMKWVGDKWLLPVHLYPGKVHYKFIVDGEWILDPNNSQWEENEHGTGNSFIWIKEGKVELTGP